MDFLKGFLQGSQGIGDNIGRVIMGRKQRQREDDLREKVWGREDSKEATRLEKQRLSQMYTAAVEQGDWEQASRIGAQLGYDPQFLESQTGNMQTEYGEKLPANLQGLTMLNTLPKAVIARIAPTFMNKVREGNDAFTKQQLAEDEKRRAIERQDARYKETSSYQKGRDIITDNRANRQFEHGITQQKIANAFRVGDIKALDDLGVFESPKARQDYESVVGADKQFKKLQQQNQLMQASVFASEKLPMIQAIYKMMFESLDADDPNYITKASQVASIKNTLDAMQGAMGSSPTSRIMGSSPPSSEGVTDEELKSIGAVGSTPEQAPSESVLSRLSNYLNNPPKSAGLPPMSQQGYEWQGTSPLGTLLDAMKGKEQDPEKMLILLNKSLETYKKLGDKKMVAYYENEIQKLKNNPSILTRQ